MALEIKEEYGEQDRALQMTRRVREVIDKAEKRSMSKLLVKCFLIEIVLPTKPIPAPIASAIGISTINTFLAGKNTTNELSPWNFAITYTTAFL